MPIFLRIGYCVAKKTTALRHIPPRKTGKFRRKVKTYAAIQKDRKHSGKYL